MLAFGHNLLRALMLGWLVFLTGVLYTSWKTDEVILQKYSDLQAEHDELVSRLSNILPGGPYIAEPEKEFDIEAFTKDISSGLDLEE
jgi:hypothetical protein